jgi:hypothetical protein
LTEVDFPWSVKPATQSVSRSQVGGQTGLFVRQLRHDEIDGILTIDRSEVIERIYRLQEGVLVLEPA